MIPQRVAYRSRPLYTPNQFSSKHLEVTIYKQAKGLIDFQNLEKLVKEIRFIEHDSVLYFDFKNDIITIKSKSDKKSINSTPILSVIKTNQENQSAFLIDCHANQPHDVFLRISDSTECSLIKQGSVICLGSVQIRFLKLYSGPIVRLQSQQLQKENSFKMANYIEGTCCHCSSIIPPQVIFCQRGCMFHVQCLIDIFKDQLIQKFVNSSTPALLIIGRTCKCGSQRIESLEFDIILGHVLKASQFIIGARSAVALEFSRFDSKKTKIIDKIVLVGNIDEGQITIGRDKNNQISIDELSVSRFHAKMIQSEGKISIVDLGSTFGTMIRMNQGEIGVQTERILCFAQKIIKMKVGVT